MRDPRIVDRWVAAVVTAATVVPALLAAQQWWVVVLAVLASVPVWWRRRAPLRVALVVGLAMTLLVLWQKPLVLPWGPLVAVYTVAALSNTLIRLASVPIMVAAVSVSLLLPDEDAQVYALIGTAFAAAFALGTTEHARRAQAAEHAERVRRLEQERTAAVMRERARIARDMHDIVTHSVGLMVVQAEAGPFGGPEAFDRIADTGRVALAHLRSALSTLRDLPDGVHQPGLTALPDLVRDSGLPVELTVEGEPRAVTPEVGVAAYRIVQEALTNVRKHAAAETVSVRVRWGAALAVEIADNGRGGPPEQGGYGLIGMHERASACGGTVHAGPGPAGFTVLARLPVE